MTRFAKIANIQDFLPDSINWDEYIARGYEQSARDRIAEETNAAALELAEQEAKLIRRMGADKADAINSQANNQLLQAGIGAAANVGMAGAKAGWFGGGGNSSTIGLGDGFNIGETQVGLDPSVDLDRWLTSSPFTSITV